MQLSRNDIKQCLCNFPLIHQFHVEQQTNRVLHMQLHVTWTLRPRQISVTVILGKTKTSYASADGVQTSRDISRI